MTSLKQSVSLCALAVALGCVASPTWAQQTPDQTPSSGAPAATPTSAPDQLSEVVVTGTRVSRPNITAAAPIVSVSSEEIALEGAVTVSDIINQLPQVAPDNQQFALGTNGSQNIINLHGVGTNRTLALIDGERIATTEGVNVNAIPVALIDRVDVLTGGTSGVYGADAVAGVVNFILKKDFDGLTFGAGFGTFQHDNNENNLTAETANSEGFHIPHGNTFDGASQNYNVAWGRQFFDNKISVEAYADYTNQVPVSVEDRSYSACYLTQGNGGLPNTAPTCQTSGTTRFGTFTPQGGPNQGVNFANNINGSQNFAVIPTSGSDPYVQLTNAERNIIYENQSTDAGLFLNYKVTPHLKYYFTYMLSSSTTENKYLPQNISTTATLNCNNPLLSAQQQQSLCGSSLAGTNATQSVAINYLPGGTLDQQYDNLDQRIASGFKGDFLDNAFHFDVNYVYATFANEQRGETSEGSTVNSTNLNSALNGCVGASAGCAPLNLFSANQTPSDAAINYIYGTERGKAVNVGGLYDDTVNLQADLGKFGVKSPLAKDGIAVNLGGEYRIDRERNDCQDPSNQIGCGDFSLSESVKEIYTEISAPLIQDDFYTHLLSFDGAYRASQYSLSSTIFSTWDLQAVYSPVKDITFRATYSRAAREPTVYEYGDGLITYGGGSGDPCAGATPQYSLQGCENNGVTAAEYGHLQQCDNDSCLARTTAAHPNPETGYTYTFGFVVQPRWIPHLTASIDYYNILVDQQISSSYDITWEQECAQYDIQYYCSHVHRNANGTLTSADQYVKGTTPSTGFVTYGEYNGYRYYNHGVDLQAQYTLPVEKIRGSVAFNFNGEYDSFHGGQGGPGQYINETAGYFGTYAGIPRPFWNQTLRTTYTTNDKVWSASANWRRIGGTNVTNDTDNPALYADQALGQNPYLNTFSRLPTYNYLDLTMTWRLNSRYSVTALCKNVLDRNPPLFPDAYNQNQSINNTIPQTYDPLGRNLRIQFTAAL